MMIKEVLEKQEWKDLYSQAKSVSGKFLQSWEWGEFQSSLGRPVRRFSDGASLAQIIELPMPFGKKFWFCPKGPVVMDNEQWTMNNTFIEELKKKAKEAGAIFLRIEPSGGAVGNAKHSHDVSPRMTSVIDLTKSEEDIFAAMHQKTRYNIRVAEKHEIKIERYHNSDPIIDELIALFSETSARDRFGIHPPEYYRKQLTAFGETKNEATDGRPPHITTFVARAGGKMLAAAVVMFDRDEATYLHGASSSEMRNLMAPYALHAAIIRRAKERGYKRYDLWGISDDPRSGWAGITRFKRGWGGDEFIAPGTLDLPLSAVWYSIYALARRVLVRKK